MTTGSTTRLTPRFLNRSYPVRPITWPTAAQCDQNGRMPSNRLHSIGPGGQLEASRAADAWNALYIAAYADGFTGLDAFTWTPGGTYRSFEHQHAAFIARWEPWRPPTGTSPANPPTGAAFYLGGWWTLRRGVARAAVPGTSNHGRGIAIDIALGPNMNDARPITSPTPTGNTGLDWLLAPCPATYTTDPAVAFTGTDQGRPLTNAESLGWSWEGTAGPVEPWHLRYFPGDNTPRRVTDILTYVGARP
jgi:hypothetical protein